MLTYLLLFDVLEDHASEFPSNIIEKISLSSLCLASIFKRLVFNFDVSVSILLMCSCCRTVSWNVSASLRRASMWHIMYLRFGSLDMSVVWLVWFHGRIMGLVGLVFLRCSLC